MPEVEKIKSESEKFVTKWTSHDQLMKACLEIFYNRFIVVCVDEKTAPASGCGINKSVKFIESLEKEFSVSLLDRMNVAYRKNSEVAGQIQICNVKELQSLISQGKISENPFVFNNLVNTKEEFEKNWEVPIKTSWHKQFTA